MAMEINNKKILVGCEESQVVTSKLRELGFDAYSCDIIETSGDMPEYHIIDDIRNVMNDDWDMIIAFPPCTHLAVSGARWFKEKKADGRQQSAIDLFMDIANANCDRIAIENPVGIMSTVWRKPDQIIQPWQFGDNATKTTCLWLKNLPKLVPDVTIKPELEYVNMKNGKRMQKWMYDIRCKPTKHGVRAKLASKTFEGIASAMAIQWGKELTT